MRKTPSGYICIALPKERLEELEIPMMVSQNEDPHRTAYTVTVDYKHGAQILPQKYFQTEEGDSHNLSRSVNQAQRQEYLLTTER